MARCGVGAGWERRSVLRRRRRNRWAPTTIGCGPRQAIITWARGVVGRDGTLWEWGQSGSRVGKPASFGVEPTQVDTNRDWMSVAATTAYTVALRTNGTLWAWGDNSIGQLGTGPGPNQTRPVQVGTNSDWAAICCPWSGTMALRRDGTLWAWGPVYVVGSWGATANNLPLPTRVCLESNWTGFVTWGFQPLVRDRSGEVWEPFHAAP